MDPVNEKLAQFYLGQEYDLSQGKALDEVIQYDARDLTTHAVVLGMTGSGKTGLGIIVLEEAALDGVPSLVIDPKGDMTNLLLTFPELRPEDFQPWVNPDDARRKNMEVAAFAAATAETWRKGLAGSGQLPDRIRRLKEAADFVIYTPGSTAGRQMSILDSFKAPALSWDTDTEILRDKVGSIVSALLALVGIEADPMRSREHILLSNLLENAWRAGQDLDLAQLILRIQNPPFSQLGVFPVDTFYPEKDRMQLAMLLNGLIASPTFSDWTRGYPLEIGSLLYGPNGKPQVSILYIAHLSEAERQFFVTLLLEQVVSWVRAQSGTTSLRALLYMDELFGYLPPHPGNPPTKKPLLTLLKQARAFGLGLVLCTQNPVDLDYKALANAGTWFIGRMQTDRDKQRLLDGLEGVEIGAKGPSRSDFDRMISSIQSRVFLLHNVHQDKPVVMTTRWAMSYLRGPLTLTQIRQVGAGPAPAAAPQADSTAPPAARAAARPAPAPPPAALPFNRVPPQLPSSVKQLFLPVQISLQSALAKLGGVKIATRKQGAELPETLVYEPALLGLGKVHFAHTQSRQTHSEEVAYLVQAEGGSADWAKGQVHLTAGDLERTPQPDAFFADLPMDLGTVKNLAALEKEFEQYLFYNSTLTLRYNPNLKLYSEPGETDSAFQRRCRQAAEAAHDTDAEKIKGTYAAKLRSLEDKLQREQRELEEDEARHGGLKQEELISGAETLLDFLGGRKSSRRLSGASRKRRMTSSARADVQESKEAIADLQAQIDEMNQKRDEELQQLSDKWAELIDQVEEVKVRPRRTDLQVSLFGLAWLPHWAVTVAGQTMSLPAYEAEIA